MTATVDFWVSIGSTYTYLAVMRAEAVAQAEGVALNWRAFSVRKIMVEQNNSPFRNKPVKAAYMWRDIARRAAARGLSPRIPAPYPLEEFDLANKVAVLGLQRGWGRDYIRAAYRLWFEQGIEAGQPDNLAGALGGLGLDVAAALEEARSDAIRAAYDAATEEAKALGVFGAPSFVAAGEVFWGDDRLEDALAWAKNGTLRPTSGEVRSASGRSSR
ncbi:2-hydroxychromene-2-carboxylate isomerase [Falsiroseomonas sp. HW251]|uniref:2-hydroxychromene-2-carboxylate isomerase n=1 Tax=Falsiroseomonas sp. HW251 TaxID=3390998 RepID=UPI003D318B28